MACTPLTWDSTVITFDSVVITFDATEICEAEPPPVPVSEPFMPDVTVGIGQRRRRVDFRLLLLG